MKPLGTLWETCFSNCKINIQTNVKTSGWVQEFKSHLLTLYQKRRLREVKQALLFSDIHDARAVWKGSSGLRARGEETVKAKCFLKTSSWEKIHDSGSRKKKKKETPRLTFTLHSSRDIFTWSTAIARQPLINELFGSWLVWMCETSVGDCAAQKWVNTGRGALSHRYLSHHLMRSFLRSHSNSSISSFEPHQQH